MAWAFCLLASASVGCTPSPKPVEHKNDVGLAGPGISNGGSGGSDGRNGASGIGVGPGTSQPPSSGSAGAAAQTGSGGASGSGGTDAVAGRGTGGDATHMGSGGSGQAGGGGSAGSSGQAGGGGSAGSPPRPLMQQAYIKASNPGASDNFGFRVLISADGTTLAIAALGETSNATGVNGNQSDNSLFRAGAVYVFAQSNGAWTQQAYLKASNTAADCIFGNGLAISGDGNTIAVGAPFESGNGTGVGGSQTQDLNYGNSGAVYVFTRSSGTWSQQAYIKASNTGPKDTFGYSVSLSGDGNVLAVGAKDDDSNTKGVDGDDSNELANGSGAVFIFRRYGSMWRKTNYIKASNTDAGDGFGMVVSLAANGDTLAVAVPAEASAAVGIDGDQTSNAAALAGAIYVFARNGASWTQQAYVKASNAQAGDLFGWSLALSADGNGMAVGAYYEGSNATGIDGDQQNDNATKSGAVYYFARSSGSWTQTAYIKASNTGQDDSFGSSVALSGDGQTLAVGAIYEDSAAKGIGGNQTSNAVMQSGAAYLFTRTSDSWKQDLYIKASNTAAGDSFGSPVGLQEDGNMLLVGASSEASNASGINGDQTDRSAPIAGAAYLFSRQ